MPRAFPKFLPVGAILILVICCSGVLLAADGPKSHPYRLPFDELKQRVIWGSVCEAPDGTALSFGGEDRDAEDGVSHTRLRVNGTWEEVGITSRKPGATGGAHDWVMAQRKMQKDLLARARHLYFEAASDSEGETVKMVQHVFARTIASPAKEFGDTLSEAPEFEQAAKQAEQAARLLEKGISPEALSDMRAVQVLLEQAADRLSYEPPARALSPIVYEPKSKLFVLFGGDHCDYLTNDTWVFDPVARKWSVRHPATAPPPRANHSWKATGDGKLVLTGGYTYFSNTDYMGGQYIDLNDGDWTYDVAANTWSGTGETKADNSRTYRTGPFLPEHFYDAPPPDAAATQAMLKALPANVWTKMNPPQLPKMNRDWGSAVIDPDRDLILRFSGGHCAHGGTDVLQYHLATNRWELCYPVEFPLGQLYSNTSYPDGFNFNHRPWISGHTYQNYGVDPILKKMIFLGHSPFGYVYDPDQGDWAVRHPLPKKMHYSGDMYTLTTTPTPGGLICWTGQGDLFRFQSASNEWKPLQVSGTPLPSAEVDNSTVIYDSHRDRLLFFRKQYGDKTKYNGEIDAVDLKTMTTSHLTPAGKDAATAIPYLCQIRYDPTNDMLLVGATLPPEADGFRRTPAYDCAANRWVSLKITGADPSSEQGRNVSLGMVYDSHRNLFWAVDTDSHVYVLKLDPKNADARDLK